MGAWTSSKPSPLRGVWSSRTPALEGLGPDALSAGGARTMPPLLWSTSQQGSPPQLHTGNPWGADTALPWAPLLAVLWCPVQPGI